MRKTTVNERTEAGIVGKRGSRRRSSRAGFTLIELVVVIGIMLLLLGLTLSVGVAVRTQSEIRETENILRLLDTAMQEWERQADRQLTWWQYPPADLAIRDRFDIHSNTAEELIISEMLDVIGRPSQIKQIIAQIAPDFLYTYQEGVVPPWIEDQDVPQLQNFLGSITVLDAWGWPIYATHPGRLWKDSDDVPPYVFPQNDDGTIQTYNEGTYGVSPNRQVIFVSAGPDGQFGDMRDVDSPAFKLTKDNVYSHPVARPLQP